MNWLHDHGVIGNYQDYLGLPNPVLEHARIWMQAEMARRASASARRGGA